MLFGLNSSNQFILTNNYYEYTIPINSQYWGHGLNIFRAIWILFLINKICKTNYPNKNMRPIYNAWSTRWGF